MYLAGDACAFFFARRVKSRRKRSQCLLGAFAQRDVVGHVQQTYLAIEFDLLDGEKQESLFAVLQSNGGFEVAHARLFFQLFHNSAAIFGVGPEVQLQALYGRLPLRVSIR